MVTPGFFQSIVTPNYRTWISDKNIRYVQYEVARRLSKEFTSYNEVDYDLIRERLNDTLNEWRGPLTLNELLEKVICDFVSQIRTEIEWHTRFDNFNPRTLYYPGTGITREEKVKLAKPKKFTFTMKY